MIGYAEYTLMKLRDMRGLAGAAFFSDCGRYRYWLGRRWDFVSKPRIAIFIGQNPSKAGAIEPDLTVSKCTGFAKRWGCTGFELVNQRAWIATDHRELDKLPDTDAEGGSIGPDNANFIYHAIANIEAALIVPAWGDCKGNRYPTPRHFEYYANARGRHAVVRCLGVTKNGHPRHPSRLPYDTELVPWE